MAFLHENGWSNALRGLEKDTGRSFDTKAHEGAKGGLLLSAISLSKEKWAAEQDAKSKGGEKRRAMRAIEENLTNPKGGRVPCVAPGRVFSGLHDANIITTRFCPRDAQSDIAGSADVRGKLTLVDTKAGKVAGVIPPGLFKAPVITMDFSPRDPVMAIGCMDGSHHIMSFALPNAQGGRAGSESSLDASDSKVNASAPPVADAKILASLERHGKYVNRIRWNVDGSMLASCSNDREVRLYSYVAGGGESAPRCELKDRFTFPRAVVCVDWGRGTSQHLLYVSLQEDNYIHTIDSKAGKKCSKYNMNSFGDDHVSFTALDIRTSSDGAYLLAATDKDRTIMFASNSELQVRNFYGAESGQYHNPRVAFDPNRSNAYCTSARNDIIGWDVGSQRLVATLRGHTKTLRCMDVHSTKPMLVSGAYDRTVRLWHPRE